MTYVLLNQNGIEENLCVQSNIREYCRPNCLVNTMNNIQECSPLKKVKRFRSAFTTEQVNYLEKQFMKFPYIGNVHRKEVAVALNIPERAVKIWFQNRRMKEKKDTGIKEFDDGQTNRKSMEFAKGQLNNLSKQSTNEKRQCSLTTKMRKPIAVKNVVPSPCNMTLKKHIIAKHSSQKIYGTTTPTKNNPLSNYKTTAEFSIDLCKKYKKETNDKPIYDLTLSKEELKVNTGKKITTDLNEQFLPEDLSSTNKTPASTTLKNELSNDNLSSVSNNSSYFSVIPAISPLYAQPYWSPGGVLWKPINVMPLVSSNSSSIPISSNQISPDSERSKRNCSCCCHSTSLSSVPLHQSSMNPQYVITTLPFQNPSAKF